MAETHVVSALVEKRAEIAGHITRFEQQIGQFRADLTHVDATIRLFAPDLTPDAIPAKVIRRSDGWFASGEVKRRVLRHASPLGPADARARRVRAVMVEKGLDPADRRAFATVQMKVGSNLRQLTARGLLCRSAKNSGAVLWRIADQAA